MIDIVGCIKLDTTKPERLTYLIACIRSLYEFKSISSFILSLHNDEPVLYDIIRTELRCFENHVLVKGDNNISYGDEMLRLIAMGNHNNNFVLNFMEDHFTLCSAQQLFEFCSHMQLLNAQVCRCTFNEIEYKCAANVKDAHVDDLGIVYEHNAQTHIEFQKPYGTRYFLGVNFITTKQFAQHFWARQLGSKPHYYELPLPVEYYFHTCFVPSKPIQAAIDDDHGEPGSSLLSSNNALFKSVLDSINITTLKS